VKNYTHYFEVYSRVEFKKQFMKEGLEPDPAAPPSRIMQGGLPNFNHGTFALST